GFESQRPRGPKPGQRAFGEPGSVSEAEKDPGALRAAGGRRFILDRQWRFRTGIESRVPARLDEADARRFRRFHRRPRGPGGDECEAKPGRPREVQDMEASQHAVKSSVSAVCSIDAHGSWLPGNRFGSE